MNLKKIIALALCVCMVLSFFPVSVFAEDWEDEVVLVDEEEYFEPQDEYVEEEIIEEEPADYAEYVEPAEELIVEEELIDEEPAAEEPAAEEPAAPAEEPAAAVTAELETAETFGAAPTANSVAKIGNRGYDDIDEALADALTGEGTIVLLKDIVKPVVLAQEGQPVIITGNFAVRSVSVYGDAKSLMLSVKSIDDLIVRAGTVVLTDTTVNGRVIVTGGKLSVIGGELKGKVLISGGEVDLNTYSSSEDSITIEAGALTISDGTYDMVLVSGTGNITGNITGGTFGRVTKTLLADGYVTDDFGNDKSYGTGLVSPTDKEAMSGEGAARKYFNLADTPANVTPKLLKNATLNLTESNSPFNVKLNGKTLTVNTPDGCFAEISTEGDVTTYELKSAVAIATVGGVSNNYSTFDAAINAAYDGGTVELLTDVEYDVWNQNLLKGWNAGPTNLTIDGKDHTWTVHGLNGNSNGNGNDLFHYATNLTVKNITVVQACDSTIAGAVTMMQGFGMNSGLLDHVTITGGRFATVPTGSITIRDCTFDGMSTALYWENEPGRQFEITGTTFKNCKVTDVMGDMIFKGNTIDSTATVNLGYNFPGAVLSETAQNSFTGNTIAGELDIYQNCDVEGNDLSAATIATKFDGRVAPVTAADLSDNYFGDSLPENIPEQVVISSVATNTEYTVSTPVVASVLDGQGKETFYATLADAVAAAGTGTDPKVISLMADIADEYEIAADQTLKVKHNGKKLNVTFEGNKVFGKLDETTGVTTYVSSASAVAKIGDTFYATLAEAVAAAQAGEIVTLVNDAELATTLTIDKAITINGDGHSIKAVHGTVAGTRDDHFGCEELITSQSYAASAGRNMISISANAELRNLTVSSNGLYPRHLVSVVGGASATLTDVDLDQDSTTIRGGNALHIADENSKATIKGALSFTLGERTWAAISFNKANETLDLTACSGVTVKSDTRTAPQAFILTNQLTNEQVLGLEKAGFAPVSSTVGNQNGFEPVANNAKIGSAEAEGTVYNYKVGNEYFNTFSAAAAAAQAAGADAYVDVFKAPADGDTYELTAGTLKIKLNDKAAADDIVKAVEGSKLNVSVPVDGIVTCSLEELGFNLAHMDNGAVVIDNWYETFDEAFAAIGARQFINIYKSVNFEFAADTPVFYLKANGDAEFTYTVPNGYEILTKDGGAGSGSTRYECAAKTYNITYANIEGATPAAPQPTTYTTTRGGSIDVVTREHYTFAGWDVSATTAGETVNFELDQSNNFATGCYGDVTLTANWTPDEYTVTFDPDNGGDTWTEKVTYPGKLTRPNDPTKTGYTIDTRDEGWYRGENPWRFGFIVQQNMTLKPKWNANAYTVTFDGNGSTSVEMPPQAFVYDEEAKALTKNTFTKTGYTFKGWATTPDAEVAEFDDQQNVRNLTPEPNGVFPLYSVWEPNSYTINFAVNAPTDATVIVGEMTPISATYDVEYTLTNQFEIVGYDFSGWKTSSGSVISHTDPVKNLRTTPNGTITLNAQWTPTTYTLTLNPNNGEENATSEYTIAGSAVLTTPEYPEHVFKGWKVTTANGNWTQDDVVPAGSYLKKYGNVTLTAQWTDSEAYNTDKGGYKEYFDTVNDALQAIENAKTPGDSRYGWYADDAVPTINASGIEYPLTAPDSTVKVNENGTDFKAVSKVIGKYAYRDEDGTWKLTDYVAKLYKFSYEVPPTTEHDGTVTYNYTAPVFADETSEGNGYETYEAAIAAYRDLEIADNEFKFIELIANTGDEKYPLQVGETVYYRDGTYIPTFADPDADHQQSVPVKFEGQGDHNNYVPENIYSVGTKEAATLTLKVAENSPEEARFYVQGATTGKDNGPWFYERYDYTVKGEAGTAYTLPSGENVTAIGYKFAGWYDKDGKKVDLPETIEVTATYEATWVEDIHTITFLDADTTLETIEAKTGDPITWIQNPTKTGYDFSKWLKSDGTEQASLTTMPDNDLILTADWSIHKANVGFWVNGVVAHRLENVEYNTQFNAPADPEVAGKQFNGWLDKDGNTVTFPYTMPDTTTAIHFYADFSDITYNVKFVMYDKTEIIKTGKYGEDVEIPDTSSADVGYKFSMWTDKDGAALAAPTTFETAEPTYYGLWTLKTANVGFWKETLGSELISRLENVAYGTEINFPETPVIVGKTFAKWVDSEGNDLSFPVTMPDTEETVHFAATYTQNNYTLTFVDVDHEGAVVTTYLTNDQMHYGDAIEPPANPTKTGGYTFNGWNYPATVDPALTMPAADVQVTAKWVGDKVTTVWIDGTDILWTNTKQEIGKEIDKPSGKTLANILARTSENKWLDPDDLWDPQPGFAEGDAMFNLKWKSEFTVSFEANGIVIKELEHIREGQTISANDAPVARKDGKDAKWLLDGELFGFDTTPVESNLTLVASWDDTPATMADFTYNMSLTENLNMKFFVRNIKDDPADYIVKVSIDGEDDQFFYPDNAEENIFTIAEFDARRMTDEIHVYVTDGDAVVLDKVYTIAGYCNAVIESTGNEKLKELANAILVYGANAQIALNYKTENLPTDDYDVTGVVIPAATATTKGSVTGVSRFGNQVMVDSNVTLRVLLQVDSTASLDDYTVTVNDTEVVPVKQSATIWYVDIPVSALKLGERQIVYVEDDNGMATYALTTIVPIRRVNNALTKALYAYYDAATAYATSI